MPVLGYFAVLAHLGIFAFLYAVSATSVNAPAITAGGNERRVLIEDQVN
jgi:hypothetical protein